MSNQASQSYQSYLSCLGNMYGYCCCSFKKIQTSTVGLMQQFGKYTQDLLPGLYYFNPLTSSIKTVSLRTRTIDMPHQTVYTKDNMSVFIDTTLFFRVIDPYRVTYHVQDIVSSLFQLTIVTLRTICGQYILQDLLTKRQQVNDKIQQFVRKQSSAWGVYIQYLLVKDMKLSQYLSQNLSKVSTTKRLVQSKIISAQADLESAMLYREAANILDIKAAVQIRFLQTLQQIEPMKSKKITILPLVPQYQQK